MALIAMCVYCTDTNGRLEYTKECLRSIVYTVNLNKHRLFLIDNGSNQETKDYLADFTSKFPSTIITNKENLGTAKGINLALKQRLENEHCIKADNDCAWHIEGWVEELEEAIEREPTIGILGLKRKDLRQTPYDSDPDFRSEYVQLPHEHGQKWIAVERSRDIMGTCTMLNYRLIDKVGGMAQPLPYAFDDSLMGLRSILSGFWNGFLSHIEIEHLDTGENIYSQEKINIANEAWPIYHEWHKGYVDGTRPLYEEI
jgi:GT2 family glycosyltransferase